MPKLRYEELHHEYWLDYESGRSLRLPSVTGIIDSHGFISEYSKNEDAALRGSYAHRACEYFLEDRLDWETIDPRIIPYVTSLARWCLSTSFQSEAAEVRLYHAQLLFAGTYDVKGIIPKLGRVLIDFKTGTAERWHEWQTAGYLLLEGGYRLRGSLYLQKDGSIAKFKQHKNPTDEAYFVSFLNTYRAKEELNGK